MGKFIKRKDSDSSSSSSEDESSVNSVKIIKKAKERRIRPVWFEIFDNWLTKTINSSGGYSLYCKLCNAYLKGSGGRTDLFRHQATRKHKKRANSNVKEEEASDVKTKENDDKSALSEHQNKKTPRKISSSFKIFEDWLTKIKNPSGGYNLYCKICKTNLKGSGGKCDLIKHQNTKKHQEKESCGSEEESKCQDFEECVIKTEAENYTGEQETTDVNFEEIGSKPGKEISTSKQQITDIKFEGSAGKSKKEDCSSKQRTKNVNLKGNGCKPALTKLKSDKKRLVKRIIRKKMKSGLNEKWLVCRICLKQPKEEMQTIFDKNAEKDLTRMILECGGVPIKQFDHYPDKICSKCYKYLQVAYKFRLTCQRSHNHLSKFIAPVEVEKHNDDELEDEGNLLGNAVNVTEDGYVLDDNNDELMVKMEQDNPVVKEEYTVHIQEEDDDFVEIYEPMTEEEEKEVFQLADDTYDNDSVPDSQENAEYLELEEDLELPSSDEEFICHYDRKTKPKATPKRVAAHASTSRKAAPATKRAKRAPKEKKPKDTSYICDFCGNKYPSQGRLTEHIKLHKGIKPHECEICGHCFAQGQQLARHMNTHTGNRPYKCSYCPAAFADLSTRNKHHRIHTNERPYVCDVCGKSFTYTNTLKFHKMIHTGEKPFVCDICGKGFPQNYKLRNHKMIHEKKGIKLEMVELTKMESNQNQEVVYHQDAHVEAAAQQLLEI